MELDQNHFPTSHLGQLNRRFSSLFKNTQTSDLVQVCTSSQKTIPLHKILFINNYMKMKLGLIQSRGMGDIIIALPIAKWYHDRGFDIYWPININFIGTFIDAILYVNFIPFDFNDDLNGFYNTPHNILKELNCEIIIPLYSYLNGKPLINEKLSKSLTFDQYKYAIACVPFSEKWNLSIIRNKEKELNLYKSTVTNKDYILIHDTGSDVKWTVKIPEIYKNYEIIRIYEKTISALDWLLIIENAKCLIMIDSFYANLVDQLNLKNEKYFIFRSEANFTPVLKSGWKYDLN